MIIVVQLTAADGQPYYRLFPEGMPIKTDESVKFVAIYNDGSLISISLEADPHWGVANHIVPAQIRSWVSAGLNPLGFVATGGDLGVKVIGDQEETPSGLIYRNLRIDDQFDSEIEPIKVLPSVATARGFIRLEQRRAAEALRDE